MNETPPKVLGTKPKEARKLLKKLLDGTATDQERQDVIAILKNYREVLDFIEHADKSWDNHVLEVDYEWRKKKNPKKSK